MKLNYEIEVDSEVWDNYLTVCDELDLDADSDLSHCIGEYIASVKEDSEDL